MTTRNTAKRSPPISTRRKDGPTTSSAHTALDFDAVNAAARHFESAGAKMLAQAEESAGGC